MGVFNFYPVINATQFEDSGLIYYWLVNGVLKNYARQDDKIYSIQEMMEGFFGNINQAFYGFWGYFGLFTHSWRIITERLLTQKRDKSNPLGQYRFELWWEGVAKEWSGEEEEEIVTTTVTPTLDFTNKTDPGHFPSNCYYDNWSEELNDGDLDLPRDLPHDVSYDMPNNHQNIDYCRRECGKLGYYYAGVQFGKECWCGNEFGTYGKAPDSDCDMKCNDGVYICGSTHRNNVYFSIQE